MSDAKTTYLENALLDHVLRNNAMTSPTTVYLALFTSDPGEIGGGTEVSGGSYARQAITFGAASNGSCTSANDIAFFAMPAATISHYAIMDALTNGNALYYGALPASIEINADNEVTFPSGSVTVSES